MSQATQMSRPFSVTPWLLASRPKTLFASLGLLILSFAISYKIQGHINSSIAFYTAMATLLMQIASNLINDATDAKSGVDTHERLGPTRVTQTGLLTYQQVQWGYRCCLTLAFVFGIPLTWHGGLVILALGIVSLIMAYIYTAGPFPLSHYGLGEVLAFFFFGPWAVGGAVYLQTLSFRWEAVLAGLLPGLAAAALMAVNNFRDREQDKLAGKTTLATLLSFTGARTLPLLCLLLSALLVPFLMAWFYQDARLLLTSFTLILFIPMLKELGRSRGGRHLNKVLALTGAYLFTSSVVLSLLLILTGPA